MTTDTAQFLLNLLATVSIQAGDPNFLQVASQIHQAQNELAEIITNAATVTATDTPEKPPK